VTAEPWLVEFERRADKDLERLDAPVRQCVITAIDRLASDHHTLNPVRLAPRPRRDACFELRWRDDRVLSPHRAGGFVSAQPAGPEVARFALPPVAVFCDPAEPHELPCLDVDARAHAARVIAALGAIPPFGGPAERDAGFRAAGRAAAGLVRCLSRTTDAVDGEQLPTRSHVQGYFRVRTTALTAPQAALHAVIVIASAIADLRNAPLAGSDIARETAAIRQVVVDLSGSDDDIANVDIDADDGEIEVVPADSQRQVWLARWIVGHHVHVLLNVYATIALQEAIALLRDGEVHLATRKLSTVTTYVKGFAPARAHAATLPSDFYNVVVRPTMVPTVVRAPLSGKMHLEYQLYRRRVDELLEVLPEPVNELALPEPELAFAREELLEADLIEAERHVCLVEPVVGNERSLIQPPRSSENAVAVLRRMRHRRAAQFEPFLRFGDHLVASIAHPVDAERGG
jgi:hypothetical protein